MNAPLSANSPFTAAVTPAQTAFLPGIIGWNGTLPAAIDPLIAQAPNVPLLYGADGNPIAVGGAGTSAPNDAPVYLPLSGGPSLLAVPQASRGSAILMPGGSPIQRVDGPYLLAQADQEIAKGSFSRAGKLYQTAQKQFEHALLPSDDPQYQAAVYGEALFGDDADAGTLKALERIRRRLEEREEALTASRRDLESRGEDASAIDRALSDLRGDQFSEALVRSSLTRRLGGSDQNSLRRGLGDLEWIVASADTTIPRHRSLVLQSYLSQVDINLQMGVQAKGEDRAAWRKGHFDRARGLLGELRALVAGGASAAERDVVAGVHRYAMGVLRQERYVAWAKDVGEAHNAAFPDHAVELDDASLDFGARLGAAIKEGVQQARFPTAGSYWKHAAWGSVAAMGAMAAAGAAGVADVDGFRDLLNPAWIGALAAVGGMKAYHGATAEETRQAFQTGISDRTMGETFFAAMRRTGELAFTYSLFGGPLPFLGALGGPLGYLVADAHGSVGQLHGPGSALAALMSYLTANAGQLAGAMADHGVGGGLDAFWQHYAQHDPLGNSLQRAWGVYERFVHYVVSGDLGYDVGSWMEAKMAHPHPEDLLILPKAMSLAWSGLTMVRPDIRNALLRKHPGWLRGAELALLPGAWLMGADIGMALGVTPDNAYRIAAVGIAKYIFFHMMLGGNGFKDLDAANMARNAIVVSMYAGIGGQMAPPALPTIPDKFLASMGIQLGLIPVGMLHFRLLDCPQFRWPLTNAWENKWKRSFTVELANIVRLHLGYSHWLGTAAGEFLQALLSPSMQKVAHEGTGGMSQRAAFISANAPKAGAGQALAPAQAAEAVLQMNARKANGNKWWNRAGAAVGRAWRSPTAAAAAKDFRQGLADAAASGEPAKDLPALAKAAYDLRSQAMKAGRKVQLSQPFTANTLVGRLIMLFTLPFTIANKPEPYATDAEEAYYHDTVYETLVRTGKRGLTEAEAGQFLASLGIIAHDTHPQFRDVAHNLLVAAIAAQTGPHKEAITKFLDANSWALSYYGISRDLAPPEGRRSKRIAWFGEHLIGSSGEGRAKAGRLSAAAGIAP